MCICQHVQFSSVEGTCTFCISIWCAAFASTVETLFEDKTAFCLMTMIYCSTVTGIPILQERYWLAKSHPYPTEKGSFLYEK